MPHKTVLPFHLCKGTEQLQMYIFAFTLVKPQGTSMTYLDVLPVV